MPMDLVVPLEMVGVAIGSLGTSDATYASGHKDYERTQLTLDTGNYDEATYYFEIVGSLTNGQNSRTVSLIDASDSVITSITIPQSASDLTRYQVEFTPTTGSETYRLRIEATDYDGSTEYIVVQTARIVIKQVNATKTRIQIPFATKSTIGHVTPKDNVSDAAGASSALHTLSTTSMTDLAVDGLVPGWKFDKSNYVDMTGTNAIAHESIVSGASSGQAAQLRIHNLTDGTDLPAATWAQASGGSAIEVATATFNSNGSNFDDADVFGVQWRNNGGSPGSVYLYRSDLYITLTDLELARVEYLLAGGDALASGESPVDPYDSKRIFVELSDYAAGRTTFTLRGYGSNNEDLDVFVLKEHGSNRSGTAASSDVTDATLNFNSASAGIQDSSSLTLTGDKNYFLRVANSSVTANPNRIVLMIDTEATAEDERELELNAVAADAALVIADAFQLGGEVVENGIYRIGRHSRDYPYVLDLPFVISKTDDDGDNVVNNVEIGTIQTVGQDLYVSWKHGTDTGVDKLNRSKRTSQSIIQSRVIRSLREQYATFSHIVVPHVGIPIDTDIEIWYSKNYETFVQVDSSDVINDDERNIIYTEQFSVEATTLTVKVILNSFGNLSPSIESIMVFVS